MVTSSAYLSLFPRPPSQVWESDGICARTLEGHTREVTTLCLGLDGFVSGSLDASVRVWSLDVRCCRCLCVCVCVFVCCVCVCVCVCRVPCAVCAMSLYEFLFPLCVRRSCSHPASPTALSGGGGAHRPDRSRTVGVSRASPRVAAVDVLLGCDGAGVGLWRGRRARHQHHRHRTAAVAEAPMS